MTNTQIAQKLQDYAHELAHAGNNLYRVRACRQAAFTIQGLPEQLSDLVEAKGPQVLTAIPGIGRSLASTIARYLRTGEWQPRTPVPQLNVITNGVHPARQLTGGHHHG